MAVLFACGPCGCSSGPREIAARDSRLERTVEDAQSAFREGDLATAEAMYRQALVRAWATDDPYESGTAAYNYAACLVSQSRLAEASDWLVDARVELCRGGASTGNTWLLSAEIAVAESRLDDADRLVARAAMTCPPCQVPDTCCLCGPSATCCPETERDCCAVSIGCFDKHHEEDRQQQECRQGYQARLALARAKIAAKRFDIENAEWYLAQACELTRESCDFSLHADRHEVAAIIHDVKGEHWQAAAHRDREVRLLRCIGEYRVMPDVLQAAAESYALAGRPELSVDRTVRAARIWFARGEFKTAWELIERVGEFALASGSDAVQIRLALTAKWIRDALQEDGEDGQTDDSELTIQPPETAALFDQPQCG
jgi:tetratricopeptide (TPR) repeat protein